MKLSRTWMARPVVLALLVSSLVGCAAFGSKFTDADLAACEFHWNETLQAISFGPRATYNESSPDPTDREAARFFDALASLSDQLSDQSQKVDDVELSARLAAFSTGVTLMSQDYQMNIRSRGTPGIDMFNTTFKQVTDYCESHGWEK